MRVLLSEMDTRLLMECVSSARGYCSAVPGPCLEASFSHILANIPLSADKYHGTSRRYKARLVDAMTFFFFHDLRADVGEQILVRSSLAHQRAQVMIVLAEQARAQLAVGGQPDTRTVATEGLRNRGDEADFAGCAIGEAVLPGGFAALVRNLLEWPAGVDALVDRRGGDTR